MKSIEKIVAERIHKKIKEDKIPQYELARRIGTNPSSLSKMLKGEKGYALKPEMIKAICEELGMEYRDVVSVEHSIDGAIPTSEDYEREVIIMMLDKLGVDVTHVKILDYIVYKCDKYTNYNYSCGDKTLSRGEMDEAEMKAKDIEEYYELEYRDRRKRISVENYNRMIESLNAIIHNSLDFIFAL